MKKKKALISSRSLQRVIGNYQHLFEESRIEVILPSVRERLSEEQLLGYIGDVDGVACGDDYFTERVLRSAKKLKVISKWGTGIDSINLDVCRELGIAVCNTPEAFTDPVADSVMAYVLNYARQISVLDKKMRAGVWEKHKAWALNELVLGVIGTGAIGRAVAMRAAVFGMRIVGYDDKAESIRAAEDGGVVMKSKDDVLCEADVLSVNCDLNASSHYLITRKEIELMKPGAYIINTARGPIIKEVDLIEALREGRLAGAALDVFEEEPLPNDSPLWEMEQVMLAPHNANSSPRAHERVHRRTVENLIAILTEKGQPNCCKNGAIFD
jgi:D-3-phosphoglycerate dehydrogenase / 2-oxoglutarate reductase